MQKLKKSMQRLLCLILIAAMCICPMDVSAYGGALYPSEDSTVDYTNGISADYQNKSIPSLYKDGKIEISGDAVISENEQGILLTGKQKAISSTVIKFADAFDFDQSQVGRITIDALAQKRCTVNAEIYLDDAETPVASIPLKKAKKEDTWTYKGNLTVDVNDQHITGSHQVTIKLKSATDSKQAVLLRSLEFVQSSIPVVYLDIDEAEGSIAAMNGDDEHETECYGNMTVQVPDSYVGEYGSQETATYEMEYIRGRGNSTWMVDKRPYKIKLSKKADLFGMGKNKHWVLLANRFDNTFLRNKMTYWMGQKLGMEFTPQSVFVDVVMNGDYLGSYYLSEQIRVGESRVEIDDLAADDVTKQATDDETISGGYLLSMEPYGGETKLSFSTAEGNEFLIESPDFEGYTNDAQYNYISNYVQNVENAIYGKDFKNEDGVSYKDLMDVDSAAKYWLMQEISRNGDGFISTSTYLYKKRGGKLYWGPLWDFDFVAWMSWNPDSSEDDSHEGFDHVNSTWFQKLFLDPDFAKAVTDNWSAYKEALTEVSKDGGILDQYAEQLRVSQFYDFEKNGAMDFEQGEPLTYAQEVERLKTWIHKRTDWVDENINTLIPVPCKISFVANGKTIDTRTIMRGDIFGPLPEAPAAKKGYTFIGWYSEEDDYLINQYDYVFEDATYIAKYVKDSKVTHAKNLYFETNELYVEPEDYFSLEYTITPFDALEDEVTWTSSDPSIVNIDDGLMETFEKLGTATITAKLSNGVTAKCKVHVIDYEDLEWPSEFKVDKTSLTMKTGEYQKITPKVYKNVMSGDLNWISTNQNVVTVTSSGVVHAVAPGNAIIGIYNTYTEDLVICKVKVTGPTIKKGKTYTVKGAKYKVTSTTSKKRTVTFAGMKSKKKITSVTIPATVKLNGKSYKVTAISAKSLKGQSKLKKITIKSSTIKSVGKEAIKGIHKKAVIKVPSKKLKAYKKLFSKKTGYKSSMKIKK